MFKTFIFSPRGEVVIAISHFNLSLRYRRNPLFAFAFEERLFVFRLPNPAFAPLFALPENRAPTKLSQTLISYLKFPRIPLNRFYVSVKNGTGGTQCAQAHTRNDNTYADNRTPQPLHSTHDQRTGHQTSLIL